MEVNLKLIKYVFLAGIYLLSQMLNGSNLPVLGNDDNIVIEALPTLKVSSVHSLSVPNFSLKKFSGIRDDSYSTEYVKFDNIDISTNSQLTTFAVEDPSFATSFMVDLHKAGVSSKVKKVDTLVDRAIKAGNFIDKLTGGDLISMPVVKKQTFGETDIYIIFQSAKIHPQFAELEVYIKIDMKKKDFLGNDSVLYFGAKNIYFSQEKGIIQGAVALIEDYAVQIGENANPDDSKAGLLIKKMKTESQTAGQDTDTPLDDEFIYSGTYVLFDCDGFKQMGLGGAVFFSRDWVVPTDDQGNERPVKTEDMDITARVNAHFQIDAQDFNDFFVSLDIDHFVLAKWKKMSFFLGNANLDLSSYRNPLNVPYPHVDQIGPAWEGVYIQSVGITMPKPFKRTSSSFAEGGNSDGPPPTERIKVAAEHLLIDEFGVYGDFYIAGQAPLIGGPVMDGEWGWSLDSIGITLEASDIVGFGFRGDLGVPILSKDKPLKYECLYDKPIDTYSFTVEQTVKKKFPLWNAAAVNLTSVGVTMAIVSEEFRPSISFSGSLEIGNPNDYSTSQTGSIVKMPGVTFEDLTLRTVSPYISVDGSLQINTGGSKIAGFPVTVSDPILTSLPNDELSLGFGLVLNLMDQGGGVSATANLALVGELNRDINGVRKWDYKRLDFSGATVTVSLPQFYAVGQLCLFEEDPVYGNGFSASLLAKIIGDDLANNDGKFKLFMTAVFGSNSGYRYWLVDGFLKSEDFSVPIVPGVIELNGFGGGAFHHMRPSAYDPALEGGVSGDCSAGVNDYSGIIYKPNIATKLGLKFSTSFTGKGGLISGLLTCIIRFGNNYALQNITFWGTAELLVKADQGEMVKKDVTENVAANTKSQEELATDNEEIHTKGGITAAVGMSFDFENSFSFHAFADLRLNLKKVIVGSGSFDLLIDPTGAEDGGTLWHMYIGGYYDNSVMVPGFFDDTPIPLGPVSVGFEYHDFNVSANAYFLTGNDIPGPPPPPQPVIDFFGIEEGFSNRGKLSCGGRGPGKGSGVAFGASAFVDFDKLKKGFFGSCVAGWKIGVGGGLGFDLALLKYDREYTCADGVTPVGGINGLRATGRVYAFIEIEKGHVTCIPLPHLGIGAKLRFDINNPSYFDGIFVLDFIKKITVGADFGDECGTPCSGE